MTTCQSSLCLIEDVVVCKQVPRGSRVVSTWKVTADGLTVNLPMISPTLPVDSGKKGAVSKVHSALFCMGTQGEWLCYF